MDETYFKEKSKFSVSYLLTEISDRFLRPKRYYLEKVSDFFYRGSQLKPEDIEKLANSGIKTIVNLKIETSKNVKKFRGLCEKYDIKYINIPVNPFNDPSEKVEEVLNVINENSDKPIYVHCLHGKDRTGLITAIYRIKALGWSPLKAYLEMESYGYNSTLFPKFRKFLFEFSANLNPA